ncbi:MAG: extensin family protein [Pseudomonadota bacterium]|uniref:extensin-like domain-containing protein n=1 Tax=Burkholderia sp. PAMC 28687 TaxID=1795874 RepID=UPI000AEA7641|nr:extensin family protein [Burkholderia sp. PAMC 28687]MDP9155963.1 extensin family protein [Pseudomonadota bacterium]
MTSRIVSVVLLLAFFAAMAFGYLVQVGRVAVPDRYNPFTPIDVHAPPGPLTTLKMWRTTHDETLCAAALEQSGLVYRPVADTSGPGGCVLKDVVRITQSESLRFSSPFMATCPLAVGIAFFEHQYLQPAAAELYGERVSRVEHVGSYACRNVNHQQDTALSQHASANAIDLTGFVLADGKRITLDGWDDASRDGAFLHRVHEGACHAFRTTLGPDYNALHKTHFHVDMGPYSICR